MELSNKKDYCSPKIKTKKFGSCYTYELLVLIAHLYNNQHSEDKIDIVPRKSKMKLWRAIQKKFEDRCGNNEACWIDQTEVKYSKEKDKLENNFRPKKPASWKTNPREWLNTYDILDVMKQYEESDKSFHFIGVFPVDFATRNTDSGTCIVQQMCNIDLMDEWKRGVKRIGVIFNLDEHDEPGSHWTSLFIGLDPRAKNFGVYYYDSVSMSPPKEILIFMKKMKSNMALMHPNKKHNIEFKVNKLQRQYKSTECGMFSILFQILMFQKKWKYDEICKNMGYDDDVVKFRDILYRPS